MGFTRGQHVVVRRALLQHEPHALHVILCAAQVALRINVAHDQPVRLAAQNFSQSQRDFALHEVVAAAHAAVVEQDAVGRVHAVRLAVIFDDPVRVQLAHRVRRARIKRRGLALRHLLHFAVQLAGGRLIKPGNRIQVVITDRFQQLQRAECVRVGRVFRHLKRDFHVRLRGQVVNLQTLHCWVRRLDVVQNFVQTRTVRHVTVVQLQGGIMKQVRNARRVDGGRAPDQAVHQIALAYQQLGQIGPVLTGDAGDECHTLLHWL